MPPGPDILVAQAIACLEAGDGATARLRAQQALELDRGFPAALNAMGLVEIHDQNNAEARLWLQKAVDASPTAASFRVSLAYSLILTAEFDDARSELDRAIALDPENPEAWQNLAWIAKSTRADPLIDRLRALKDRAAFGSHAFVKYAFALGKWLDDAGDYDAAFAAFNDANLCQPSNYDAQRHEKFFADVKSTFTQPFIEERQRFSVASEKPVFIVGMPRSGSTLLEDKLCAHPAVAGLGETRDIIAISGAMTRTHPRGAFYPFWCVDAPMDVFRSLGETYIADNEKKHPTALRLVNKSLLNYAYAGMIATMFPKGLIIESRRNPLDTCLSCYFQDLKRIHHYAVRLETLGHAYRLYADVMAHWSETLDNLIVVSHEKFVADIDGVLRSLYDAMKLDPENAEGRTAAQNRAIQTFSAWQVRQPVSSKAVGRWKNYEKHLGPLIEALGDLADV